MKKYFLYFFIFFNFIACNAGMRHLVMLIDWNNEQVSTDLNKKIPASDPGRSTGFGPILGSLVTALVQQAAPILVSSATWKNFIERKQIFNDFISLPEPTLIQKYKGKYQRFATAEGIEKFAYLCKQSITPHSTYIKKLPLNDPALQEIIGFIIPYITLKGAEQWSMHKITDHWYLLIPKNYMQEIKKEFLPPRPVAIASTISNDELQLGLKMGKPLENPFDPTKHDDKKIVLFQEEFFTAIKQLFITFSDLVDRSSKEETEKNRALFMHNWLFYLLGHGSPSSPARPGVIAGLNVKQFQDLLTFFNFRIDTDFLYYSTCFAGGEHLKTPYVKEWFYPPLQPKDPVRKAVRAEVFNYIIAAQTLVYASTFGWAPTVPLPFRLNVDQSYYPQHFPLFFKSIKEYLYPPKIAFEQWKKLTKEQKKKQRFYPSVTLERILNYITVFLTKTGEIHEGMQIPVVRFPGTNWFSVIDMPKKIFNITQILAETRAAEGREIVVTNKEVIIVHAGFPVTERRVDPEYHSELLVPLSIKKVTLKKAPTFLSYGAGPAKHYFDNISARGSGIVELLRAFIPPINEHYPRSYYIKKLICRNDNSSQKQNNALGMKFGEGIELDNVIIIYNAQNPINPEDNRKLNGIFFSFQQNYFYSFWQPDDLQKWQRLQKNEFPGLTKVIEKDFIAPQYPYKLPEARLAAIAQLLKKKVEEQKRGVKKAVQNANILIQKAETLSVDAATNNYLQAINKLKPFEPETSAKIINIYNRIIQQYIATHNYQKASEYLNKAEGQQKELAHKATGLEKFEAARDRLKELEKKIEELSTKPTFDKNLKQLSEQLRILQRSLNNLSKMLSGMK